MGLSIGLILLQQTRKTATFNLVHFSAFAEFFLVHGFFRQPESIKRSDLYRRSRLAGYLVHHSGLARQKNQFHPVLALRRVALFRHLPEPLHLHVQLKPENSLV